MAIAPAQEGKPQSRYTNKEILRRVAQMFRPYRRDVVYTIVAVLIGTGLGILPPLWFQTIIDQGITNKNFSIDIVLCDVFLYSFTNVFAA